MTGRRGRPAVWGTAAVVGAALIGILGYPSFATSSSAAAPTSGSQPIASQSDDHHTEGMDGRLSDGATPFDDVPAVTRLDPPLLAAVRAAAQDAARDGTTLYVNSGWRSRSYQSQLLREAISTYGSESEASRWVAAPGTSPHVTGKAVDIGLTDAMSWLSQHGAAYELCQIYANEPWHYELRPGASAHGCPAMYPDPTTDPRMQGEP